ncbi:MAG: hypothetical protein ACJZ4V_04165 [Candidatus Poseidoniaceae archaeon]
MAIGHTWDRESREWKIIQEIFAERFPEDFIKDWLVSWPWDDQYDVEETFFQGFLAAWEFLRRITESNDELLKEVSKLAPPKWDGSGWID